MVERENGLTKNGRRKVCLLTAAYQPNLPEGMADEDLCVWGWGGVKGFRSRIVGGRVGVGGGISCQQRVGGRRLVF